MYIVACKYSNIFPEHLKKHLGVTLAWPEYGLGCRKDFALTNIAVELATLLSFGILCPAYGVVCMALITVDISINKITTARFVKHHILDVSQEPAETISSTSPQVELFDRSAIDSHSSLKHCMWPAFTLSSIFMSMILWDMASDEVSFTQSIGIPLVTLLSPSIIWILTRHSNVYTQSLRAAEQKDIFATSKGNNQDNLGKDVIGNPLHKTEKTTEMKIVNPTITRNI